MLAFLRDLRLHRNSLRGECGHRDGQSLHLENQCSPPSTYVGFDGIVIADIWTCLSFCKLLVTDKGFVSDVQNSN